MTTEGLEGATEIAVNAGSMKNPAHPATNSTTTIVATKRGTTRVQRIQQSILVLVFEARVLPRIHFQNFVEFESGARLRAKKDTEGRSRPQALRVHSTQ